jgi:hypothetical protein
MLSELTDFMANGPGERPTIDELPAAIRAELNADTDRDVLIRMRLLAGKKRMREPEISEEQMADYLALSEDFKNFEQWRSARRGTDESPAYASITWMAAIAAILGLLTVTLVIGIAVTV